MKKVIKISNDPDFNFGVITYICMLNIDKDAASKGLHNGYYANASEEHAKDFEYMDLEYMGKAIAFLKKSFPKATVEITYLKK